MKKEVRSRVMTFLLLAGVCIHLVPEVAKAVIFYLKESGLADWVLILCEVVGVLVGLTLMLFAMKTAFTEVGQKNKGLIGRYVIGAVNTVFVYLAADVLMDGIYAALVKLFGTVYWVVIVLFILFALVCTVIQGLSLYLWAVSTMAAVPEKPIRRLMSKPLKLLGVIALAAAANGVPDLVAWVLGLMPETLETTVAAGYLIYLVIAAVQATVLGALFGLIAKAAENGAGKTAAAGQETVPPTAEAQPRLAENDQSENAAGKKKGLAKYPFVVFAAAGIVLIMLIRGISYYSQDPVEVICDSIDEAATMAGAKLMMGDIEGALKDMQTAELILDLWGGVLGMADSTSLDSLYYQNPSNKMIAYLYFVQDERIDALETYLRVNEMDPQFCLALLEMYEEREGLTEQQEVLRDELKYVCVTTQTYQNSMLRIEDLQGKEEKLELKLREYDILRGQSELLEIAGEVLKNSTATKEMVYDSINLAEKYPDDWNAQYLAAIIGSSLTYDGAGHYDETITAAKRFEELYRDATPLEDEELIGLELKVAKMIITCYGYQEALPYLEQASELGGLEQAFSMSAQCYEALQRYDDCYELCYRMLEEKPELVSARYYAAISALKADMLDEALEQTSLLADLVKEKVTKTDYSADVALYSLVQFITINDTGSWTEYDYAFYNRMTDEQKAIVESNPFLMNYLEAAYQCFAQNGKESEDKALEAVDHVLAENENLPQAWYLKGAILYDRQEFEESVEAYQKSLAIAPESATAWYALANAYDGMGEYRLAYEACERTMALLPEQDHGSDWYGVSVHCENLMNGLKNKLEGGN